MAAVTLHKLKGAEEVIIYQTICLNDYVQLCHINAFYYGNMYIYCQMPKKKEWMSERDRGPDSTAVHWNEKCCRQERAGLTNTDSTDPTYRPWRFSFLSFFKYILFHIFFEVFNTVSGILPTPDTPTQHGLTWATASSWALKEGAATLAQLHWRVELPKIIQSQPCAVGCRPLPPSPRQPADLSSRILAVSL